jgi:hypothetical protein
MGSEVGEHRRYNEGGGDRVTRRAFITLLGSAAAACRSQRGRSSRRCRDRVPRPTESRPHLRCGWSSRIRYQRNAAKKTTPSTADPRSHAVGDGRTYQSNPLSANQRQVVVSFVSRCDEDREYGGAAREGCPRQTHHRFISWPRKSIRRTPILEIPTPSPDRSLEPHKTAGILGFLHICSAKRSRTAPRL